MRKKITPEAELAEAYIEDLLNELGWDFETDPVKFFSGSVIGTWVARLYLDLQEIIEKQRLAVGDDELIVDYEDPLWEKAKAHGHQTE